MSALPPPLPAAQRPGWWQRHWRWAVPLLCVLCASLLVGAILLFVSALFGMMRSSEVYTVAMQRARDNPTVVEALGTPIEPGWYLTGEMNTSGASGNANLQIPISGPNGKGDLYIEAKKNAGRWDYQTLTVDIDGREAQIDLLTEETDSGTPQ
jgi:Cytochrome oxidase complex assembly protein 1